MAGLTKRDIQLVMDGGYMTVESVAYTPRRILEQLKGISEQKAQKILGEGMSLQKQGKPYVLTRNSIQTRSYGLYDGHRDAPAPQ